MINVRVLKSFKDPCFFLIDFAGLAGEPGGFVGVQERGDALAHHEMVVVDLGDFLVREHRAVDKFQIVGVERQRLEGEKITELFGLIGFNGQQQVFGTDTLFAGLVQTWLVAGNHAWHQLDVNQVGADALGPLVASQEVTHAVTSSVAIGHGLLP